MEAVRHHTQKEVRICDVLEPALNQHRLIVDHQIIKDDFESTQKLPPEQALRRQLFYQMSRLTRLKGSLTYDDRVDVLSFAVQYFVEQMARDADQAVFDRKQEQIRDDLEVFSGSKHRQEKTTREYVDYDLSTPICIPPVPTYIYYLKFNLKSNLGVL